LADEVPDATAFDVASGTVVGTMIIARLGAAVAERQASSNGAHQTVFDTALRVTRSKPVVSR
jgi:hypothetical protein